MKIMTDGSFEFNGKNSVDVFGIYVIQHTMVVPPKRIRKREIPYKDGVYNYGVKSYGEIGIELDCYCEKEYTRGEFRKVSQWLSKKGKLYFWDESDKHYKGEFETYPNFDEYTMLRMSQFRVGFVAFPFAFSEETNISLTNGLNPINYVGTRQAPTIITIENKGFVDLVNIRLAVQKRRE